ncbi:MAG: shikimate dehydrogenase [Chloroflexi bacterium]|nr:shikimate dehydrogenase [Chloroflexota bacterium]
MSTHAQDPSAALQPRTVPTIYFIGVTTGKSSIMRIFPKWSDLLGLGAAIAGYDAPLGAPAEVYRAIVEHIKHDPLSLGALVTTHKIDLLAATHDLFDYLDPHAELCGEISCIAKRDGRLAGYAKDPISSGLAWQHFVPASHWGGTDAAVLCLGAGGAAMAISVFAAQRADPADRPRRFIAVDIARARLDHLAEIHAKLDTDVAFDYVLNDDPAQNDALLGDLPAGSMVINATGMGKDRPGSPLTDAVRFPQGGLVWELNYRGERLFLQQAQSQAAERQLIIEDGWVYFLHGWTQVISEVFKVELTPQIFQQLDQAASNT